VSGSLFRSRYVGRARIRFSPPGSIRQKHLNRRSERLDNCLDGDQDAEAPRGVRRVRPALGLPALVLGSFGNLDDLLWAHLGQFVVFTPLIILGEMIPIGFPRGDNDRELTASKTFAFALLLMAGPAAALLAMLIASLVSDARRHSPPWRRRSTSLVTASPWRPRQSCSSATESSLPVATHPTGQYLGAFLLAGAVFFTIDGALPAIASVLGDRRRGRRAWAMLFDDFAFRAGAAATLISAAPAHRGGHE